MNIGISRLFPNINDVERLIRIHLAIKLGLPSFYFTILT